MTENAEKTLWDMRANLDPVDKSSPPALTDVFVARARQFLADGSEETEKAFDEVIDLSIKAGIPRYYLYSCLATMREVGSITFDEQEKLLDKIPDEQKEV